jgi:tRNA-2-methylthio-N6-dimethylallyladenosine synthase
MAPGESAGAGPIQLAGRTWCDRIVVFEGNERLIGSFLPVEVEDASAVTLFGRAATRELAASGA